MATINFNQVTNITEVTRIVRLSYLQTVAVLTDTADLSELAGEGGALPANTFTASDPGSPGFLGIGSEGPSSQTQTFTDSGWSISRTWQETYWDKIRWAIGIKEVGIYSFSYEAAGEFVSVPFKAPTDIEKVTLEVEELIPTSYPNTQPWIQYYITGNDGQTWTRISPIDTPTVFTDGGRSVPRIINFNPDFESEDDDQNRFVKTQNPVRQIRFRAILLRPNTQEFAETTPILKQYRLQIVPKGAQL